MEDNSDLEKLKSRLYRQDEVLDKRLKRRETSSDGDGGVKSFWEQNLADKKDLRRTIESIRKRNKPFSFWLIGGLAIVLLIIFSGIFLYFFGDLVGLGGNIVSSKKIDMLVEGPSLVESGAPNKWYVSITNNNNADLELADLIIEYPKGSLSLQSESLSKERRPLGKILSTKIHKEEVNVFVLGKEDEQLEIKFTLEYRIAGSNAIFAKEGKQVFKLSRSPMGISINLPEEVESGQEISVEVEYISNSESLLKDIYLRMDYPPGFRFLAAVPEPFTGNNTWKVGDLMPQEKRTLEIRGVLEGQDSTELSFNAAVGIIDINEGLSAFSSMSNSVMLKKSVFNLDFSVTGEEAGSVLSGQNLKISVPWKNNLPTEIRNASISVEIKGQSVDIGTISVSNGFYNSYDNTVVWNSSSLPALALVAPGTGGVVEFSFSLKKDLPVRSVDDKNFTFVLEGDMLGFKAGEQGQNVSVKSSVSREIKIVSDVKLFSGLLFSSGPFKNSGSLPPRAGQQTTYTVVWSVSNYYNDVSGAVVRSSIPSYVSWLGAVNPSQEEINYNSSTGEVVWKPGKVEAGTGLIKPVRQVAFQISFLPALNQINGLPDLVATASFEGRDSFTGRILRSLAGALSTGSISEAASDLSLGRVVE
ncbi:hypothetical protein KKB69_00270 [Patescibacteria group bacterium]|nr:hypothetical protein [Patescibacteria group bacterium]